MLCYGKMKCVVEHGLTCFVLQFCMSTVQIPKLTFHSGIFVVVSESRARWLQSVSLQNFGEHNLKTLRVFFFFFLFFFPPIFSIAPVPVVLMFAINMDGMSYLLLFDCS